MAKEEKASLKERLLARKKLIIGVLVVIAVGFGIWRFLVARRNGEVESTVVMRGKVAEELILSGEIDADEYVQLQFPASGKISWVGVKEGDQVKSGQALMKLDTTTLNSAFQQARATLRAAEAALENVHDQVKDNDDDESFEQKDTRTAAEATKDRAYEAYISAEYNLRNSTLIAPFAGLATFVAHPFSGINVLFSETQIEMINPETIYFDVSADQSEVVDLSMGQKVNIVLDSFLEEEFEGEVAFISYTPKTGEVGAVYKVKVKLVNADSDSVKYRIGMTGDAKFALSEKDNVLYLPPEFVNTDKKGKYIRKGKENNKVYIKVGIEGEERVEITGDVNEGDIVFD